MLAIKKLTAIVAHKEVVRNLSLSVRKGEIHALMGPNGSGKTSLASVLLGNGAYRVTKGTMTFAKKNIAGLPTEKRSALGMFLSFQEVPEIPGVGMSSFLRAIARKHNAKNARATMEHVESATEKLGLSSAFMKRFLNDGFSGGEKRKSEMLQLIASQPKLAILDEIDAGMDIDSLKIITTILKRMVKNGMALIVISHSPRLIKMLKPDYIHVMCMGTIVTSGGGEIARKLEKHGYQSYETKNRA